MSAVMSSLPWAVGVCDDAQNAVAVSTRVSDSTIRGKRKSGAFRDAADDGRAERGRANPKWEGQSAQPSRAVTRFNLRDQQTIPSSVASNND